MALYEYIEKINKTIELINNNQLVFLFLINNKNKNAVKNTNKIKLI